MSSVRPKLARTAFAAVTAWDTLSGKVIYRTASGRWSQALEEAEILAGQDAYDAALEVARADALVNTPYAMEVDSCGRIAGREALRESLRARGPGDTARSGGHLRS